MRVGECTLAALDGAEDHLEVLRAEMERVEPGRGQHRASGQHGRQVAPVVGVAVEVGRRVGPVSRLGDEFYLGELFRYHGPGFWFGLPLGSQLGFAATACVHPGQVEVVRAAYAPSRCLSRSSRG